MRVLIAGGGTGGHLFPAVALAETFGSRFPEGEILFVGTNNPLEISVLSKRGYNHMSIAVEGLKGRGLWCQIRALFRIPKGFFQAVGIIWRFDPDVIVGVGGYASGPVALAARLMGKKVVIHEQNIFPGLTNRILARFANSICISFPDKLAVFKSEKTLITGNPVRRDVLETKAEPRADKSFKVLVVGGSQGAHAINRTVVDALDYLKAPENIAFIHQAGEKDALWVEKAYRQCGIDGTVSAFFEDMAGAYRSANLVVCRAGATTVAELTALGKPAIFIPFPFAANNHQEFNARYVEDSGGGEVILEKDLNGRLLASKIESYAVNPEAMRKMSTQSAALGRPEAADLIVEECRRLVVVGS
jgi:UDP-N-acetylglucosamine--N-acetylmuramyl-(pentapeptide) pyrophosphoryl-undecaprenol N-acetylglucosamine transferase